MRTTNWALDKSPNRVRFPGQVDCGPFQVVDVRVGQPKHYVPHYLPGTNPFLKEFGEKFRLPTDLTMGGPASMYPEAARKLERQVNGVK